MCSFDNFPPSAPTQKKKDWMEVEGVQVIDEVQDQDPVTISREIPKQYIMCTYAKVPR